ncbi:MAG: STAS domain-containing protein [Terriglobales bacterium]|jgi:anti-sigma B factor antagonist
MLEIQTKQVQPDIVVLELTGKITLGRQCKQLEWAVENLVGEGRKKLIFDFSGVTSVDSTGIGIIVMSAGQVKKAGGELRVAGATEHIEQVLKTTNIHQIIALHPSAAAAAAAF